MVRRGSEASSGRSLFGRDVKGRDTAMSELDAALYSAMELPGVLGVAVAEIGTARSLRDSGDSELVRPANALNALLDTDSCDSSASGSALEEALLMCHSIYHILRPLRPERGAPVLFLLLAIDRSAGNLVLSRRKAAEIAEKIAEDTEVIERTEQVRAAIARSESALREQRGVGTEERRSVPPIPEYVASDMPLKEGAPPLHLMERMVRRRGESYEDGDDMAPYLQDEVVLKLLGLQ